jgi:hypothetical protein
MSVEIRDSKSVVGKGLFALQKFNVGQVVFTLTGTILDKPIRESIHVGGGIHILDERGAYINHSFDPTTIIDNINVVAIKELNEGDEITFNYNESEINMASPFYVHGVHVHGKQ